MNTDNLFEKHKLYCGRMISASKSNPQWGKCVWNANVISRSEGKIWYGDLNLTKEGTLLKEIANELGEPLYVLKESDCRFNTENDSIEVLISRAVWNTNM